MDNMKNGLILAVVLSACFIRHSQQYSDIAAPQSIVIIDNNRQSDGPEQNDLEQGQQGCRDASLIHHAGASSGRRSDQDVQHHQESSGDAHSEHLKTVRILVEDAGRYGLTCVSAHRLTDSARRITAFVHTQHSQNRTETHTKTDAHTHTHTETQTATAGSKNVSVSGILVSGGSETQAAVSHGNSGILEPLQHSATQQSSAETHGEGSLSDADGVAHQGSEFGSGNNVDASLASQTAQESYSASSGGSSTEISQSGLSSLSSGGSTSHHESSSTSSKQSASSSTSNEYSSSSASSQESSSSSTSSAGTSSSSNAAKLEEITNSVDTERESQYSTDSNLTQGFTEDTTSAGQSITYSDGVSSATSVDGAPSASSQTGVNVDSSEQSSAVHTGEHQSTSGEGSTDISQFAASSSSATSGGTSSSLSLSGSSEHPTLTSGTFGGQSTIAYDGAYSSVGLEASEGSQNYSSVSAVSSDDVNSQLFHNTDTSSSFHQIGGSSAESQTSSTSSAHEHNTAAEGITLSGLHSFEVSTLVEQNRQEVDHTTDVGTSQDCVCVPYYLCRDNHIITDGDGIINIRLNNREDPLLTNSRCRQFIEVCCALPLDKPDPEMVGDIIENTYVPQCGQRHPQGISVYLEGFKESESQFGEFPWMALILEKVQIGGRDDLKFVCGGSLISRRVVLTAAHCVHGLSASSLRVRLGEWDTKNERELLQHEDFDVSGMRLHERFNPRTLFNDVALLQLADDVTLQRHIDTICLPSGGEIFDTEQCVATGFGKERFTDERYQNIMKQVELQMVGREECQRSLRRTRLGRWFQLHSSFTCAGGQGGADTCTGDGGSPLVCRSRNQGGRYVQTGIVAWGIGCGDQGVPGVYGSVVTLLPWIHSQLAQLEAVHDSSAPLTAQSQTTVGY